MAKGQTPWIKFEPGAWRSDPIVRAMSAIERGIFIALFCDCWEEKGLVDDFDLLAITAGVTREEFDAAWQRTIRHAFKLVDGRWWNKRLHDDYLEKCETNERKRQSAIDRWERERGKERGGKQSKGITPDYPPSTGALPKSTVEGRIEEGRVNTLAGVTRARGEPEPVQNRPPDAVEAERQTWTAAIDRLLERELVSLEGRRVLVDLLDLRCESEREVRRLRLPRTEQGWLELARQVDQDLPRAQEALRRMRASSGVDFDRHLRWVDEDREKAERGGPQDPLGGVKQAMSLALERQNNPESVTPTIYDVLRS